MSSVRSRVVTAASAAVAVVALSTLAGPAANAAPADVPGLRLAAPAGGWAPAASAPIRPGVITETTGGGACTSNFVFTSGDRVFLGQAAHCAGTGNATETNGCTSGTMPLGTAVTIRAADGSVRTGSLAYSSWIAMQEVGETDPNPCAFNDFALVEIAPADVADVNPSVPFFGGPIGVDDDGAPFGERVYSYGNSPLRLGLHLASPKVGVSAGDVGEGWSHDVFTFTPGVPGDSGSAVLDADGEALGVLSTLNLAPLPASNGVSNLAHALGYARVHGFDGLELAPGTEPFTSTPAGIPPIELASPAGPPVS